MAKLVLTITANNKATQSVSLLNKEVEALSKTLSSITVNNDLTAQIKALTDNYKEMGRVVRNTLQAETQQITNQARQQRAITQTASKVKTLEKRYADLLSAIKAVESKYPKGTFDRLKADAQTNLKAVQGLTEGTENYNDEVKRLTAEQQNLATQFAVTKAETEKVTTAVVKSGDSIGSLAKKFLLWQVTATLVMKPLRLISDALNSINETLVKTEDAVIALQRVLPNGSASDGEISSRLYKIVADYGQTFENVSQIAQNFARTGMSWADTIKATEAAVLALNVAELDAQDASDGLISILTQFDKTTADLTETVDKLNKAADNNPVTTEKLLKALQRTGAAAKQANISLDDTIGIITTLSKATNRSGENLGTAVNSLIQFSSKASSLDTFAKLGGNVETAVEKYRAGAGSILEIWQELSTVIKDRNGQAEGILGSLFGGDDWENINSELKEALGEAYADITDIYSTSSTFRRNYWVALLLDMENVKKVSGEIADAQGYSQKENQKYLDTYTAKLNTLKAQWEDIANDEQGLLGIKKGLVDVGSTLLSIIKWTGGLRTTLLAVGTIAVALFGTQLYGAIAKAGGALKTFFTNLVAGFKAGASAASKFQAALGWIGLVGTALSLIIGGITRAIREQKEAEEQANKTAVEHWQSIREEAQQLEELSKKYATLTSDSEEYEEVEKNIVELLGTKAIRLANLTKGTEEYRKEVEKLTKEQRQQNKEVAQRAANSAQELFDNQKYSKFDYADTSKLTTQTVMEVGQDRRQLPVTKIIYSNTTEFGELIPILEEAGFSFEKINSSQDARGYNTSINKAKIKLSGNTFQDEKTLSDLKTFLSKNGYADTSFYNEIFDAWESRNKAISDYLNSYVPSYAYEDITSNAEFDSIIKKIMEATGATEEWRSTIEGIVSSISGFKKVQEETTDNWTNDLKDAKDYYDDLIKKLEEMRDAEKDALELEEKKQALLDAQNNLLDKQNALKEKQEEIAQKVAEREKTILEKQIALLETVDKLNADKEEKGTAVAEAQNALVEKQNDLQEKQNDLQEKQNELQEKQNDLIKARQALESARNEATVRRFNEATGQWEWQVDEKKVQSAQDDVDKAQKDVDNAQEAIKKGEEAVLKAQEAIKKGEETVAKATEELSKIEHELEIVAKNGDVIKAASDAVAAADQELVQSIKDSTTSISQALQALAASEEALQKEKRDGEETLAQAQKDIIEAQEKIATATRNLQQETYNQIISQLKDEKATNDSILEILKEVVPHLGADFAKAVKDVIKEVTGVSIYTLAPEDPETDLEDDAPPFDSGGIANGLGYMPKATALPESVNDPAMTAKILSPVSNREFENYTKSLGILFEQAHDFARSPVIERVGGNVDNRVDNSGQITMNGVTIGSDKRGNSLEEILRVTGIVNS